MGEIVSDVLYVCEVFVRLIGPLADNPAIRRAGTPARAF
jgi:hypothetical protein